MLLPAHSSCLSLPSLPVLSAQQYRKVLHGLAGIRLAKMRSPDQGALPPYVDIHDSGCGRKRRYWMMSPEQADASEEALYRRFALGCDLSNPHLRYASSGPDAMERLNKKVFSEAFCYPGGLRSGIRQLHYKLVVCNDVQDVVGALEFELKLDVVLESDEVSNPADACLVLFEVGLHNIHTLLEFREQRVATAMVSHLAQTVQAELRQVGRQLRDLAQQCNTSFVLEPLFFSRPWRAQPGRHVLAMAQNAISDVLALDRVLMADDPLLRIATLRTDAN